ncbi:hypothetical protein MMC25_004935 [Agyrium rufum]|nr:hypothetical protein [Agyrium rufum]
MAAENHEENGNISKPKKRIRWATQRVKSVKGQGKRNAILQRFHKSTGSNAAEKEGEAGGDMNGVTNDAASDHSSEVDMTARRIYFNQPLPPDMKDEEGNNTTQFSRNKIRTAKYTPLSFLPKELWLQFHSIPNQYFAFLVILAIFPIFGASNPGLNAVPILFILFVTAVKDGIEDWRRTVLDNELNNSPVHRLVDWENVNVSDDNVTMWRKFKKATTRTIIKTYRSLHKRKGKNSKSFTERSLDEPRQSFETGRRTRASIASINTLGIPEDDNNIQLTPVPSPQHKPQQGSPMDYEGSNGDAMESEGSYRDSDRTLTGSNGWASGADRAQPDPAAFPAKMYGSIIDPRKQATGKPRFHKDYWKNVEVGDFVRIYNDDQIPADVAVLSTSDPDGACYVETKNLDGETNLKVRQAMHCGRLVKHARDCERTNFVIESEAPHPNLYKYSGVLRYEAEDPANPDGPWRQMQEPVSINNLLLRGCSLRNTEWILGIVLFTGRETKIMLNSGITPSKRSRIARDLNKNVIYNFLILFLMCLVSGTVQGVTWSQGNNSLDFFEFGSIGGTPALDGFITFWSAVILFQNLVPISLYISLEIIRLLQAFFIYNDVDMYYDRLDYPCTPKTWNISDDVGQIEYIFSDKTGTLTQNVMEFRKCTINGAPYGEAYTEAQAGLQRRQGVNVEVEGPKIRAQIAEDRVQMLQDIRSIHDNPYLHDDELTFVSTDFVNDLKGVAGEEQKNALEQFMLALALCHTVITERTPGDPPKIEFKAQSPDEAALVATARDMGFTVLGRTNDGIILNVQGEEKTFQVLNTLEFNSSRKRMSAIIRAPDGRLTLYCKGADSVIYSRLRRGEQGQLRKDTAEHLEVFAREGLRTLCIAQRELSEEEYSAWSEKHDIAASAVQNREDKLEEVSDAIEQELTLLGGTAIEDRLQDGVPDTIALLGQAGIKLWVLTGDKVETAINIGFSCNLLDNNMDLILFTANGDDLALAEEELDRHLVTFGITGSDAELKAARKNHEAPGPTHAVVIDGDALKLVLDDKLQQKFLLLCKQCKSVLCCRVSPSQKAAVVHLVKTGLDVMTLSIGDGANDVAMIQEADVGVGIAGEEGRQAVMTSDYAIGQFRFLQRLILVHGRWSYRRVGETIANFFYKNIVWTFCLFWYQIANNFDCSYLFDYTYILLFNLAFSSLPIIFMGILDQDVDDLVSLAVPQLYRRGIERKEWTQTKFWLYMSDGIYQSAICFFLPYLFYLPSQAATSNGLQINDQERLGVYVGSAAVVVVNVYILMNTYRWDWLMLLLVAISILLIWLWTGIYSSLTYSQFFYGAATQVYGQLSYWVTILLVIIACLLPRFAIKSLQKVFRPYDVDIIREQVRLGKFAYLKESDPASAAKSAIYGSSPAAPVNSHSATAATSADAAMFSANGHNSNKMNSERGGNNNSRSTHPNASYDSDFRPFYPASLAQTATTSQQAGSDGTDSTGHRLSLEQPPARASMDRPRPSFERVRMSMGEIRPSFEQSRDFTSAAYLTRVESSNSQSGDMPPPQQHSSSSRRGQQQHHGRSESGLRF